MAGGALTNTEIKLLLKQRGSQGVWTKNVAFLQISLKSLNWDTTNSNGSSVRFCWLHALISHTWVLGCAEAVRRRAFDGVTCLACHCQSQLCHTCSSDPACCTATLCVSMMQYLWVSKLVLISNLVESIMFHHIQPIHTHTGVLFLAKYRQTPTIVFIRVILLQSWRKCNHSATLSTKTLIKYQIFSEILYFSY